MKRHIFFSLALLVATACGGDRVAELERELDEVKAQLTTSTTTSTTTTSTTTSTSTTTTTAPPTTTTTTTTTTAPSAPDRADLTGDVDAYTESLAAVLISAAGEDSCTALVDAAADEIGFIFEHTYAWIENLAEAESTGDLDVEALQEEATDLAQKFIVFEQMMDQLVEAGGPRARFGADASDALGAFGFSLLTWGLTGIDLETGTIDAGQMQELGMVEQLVEVNRLSTGIGDDPTSTVYCR